MKLATRVQIVDVATGVVESKCTLAEFFAANEIGAEWQAEVVDALTAGRSYEMGGGAAPFVRVELIPKVGREAGGRIQTSHRAGLAGGGRKMLGGGS